MSTARAIELVTNALVARLKTAVGDDKVITKSLDKAIDDASGGMVNLFLYQTTINAAWRNQDFPTPRRGQPGRPLLPLTLHYLLTAGLKEDNDADVHAVLGQAMLALHDNPNVVSDSADWNQPDAAHITPVPLTLDEMSKLWSAFQASYRLSVAYEVSTVLIESGTAAPVPLPVRKLGDVDRGWDSTTQFPPLVEGVKFQSPRQPGVQFGERFSLVGRNFPTGSEVSVRLTPTFPLTGKPFDTPVLRLTDTEATSVFSDSDPAGIYLTALVEQVKGGVGDHFRTSNAVPVAYLPQLVGVPPAGFAVTTAAGTYTLNAHCEPPPTAKDRVHLLIGSRAVPARVIDPPVAGNNVTATWPMAAVTPHPELDDEGSWWGVRVRVNGAESFIPLIRKPDGSEVSDPRYFVKEVP